MLALQILGAAFLTLPRNLPTLLRLLLPSLLVLLAALGLIELLTSHRPAPGLALWAQRVVLVLTVYAAIAAATWMVIQLHRQLLRAGTEDHTYRPYVGRILVYLGALGLIALILTLPGAVVLLLVTQLVLPMASASDPMIGLMAMLLVKLLALTGFLCLSPILPAIALGRRLSLPGAISLSVDHVATIALLALLLVALDHGLLFVLQGLGDGAWVGWVAAILRVVLLVSVVSQLYRHCSAAANLR